MQLISTPEKPVTERLHSSDRSLEAIAGLVACIGASTFSQEGIAQLNRWLPVSWWSVFQLRSNAPPDMPAAGSYKAPDHTADSWQVYRSSLYRQDQTFLAAWEETSLIRPTLVHWHAREIPRQHREMIYVRHGLRERLSIVCRLDESSLMAVNLYRHDDLPEFSDTEIDQISSASSLIAAMVRRHLELDPRVPMRSSAFAVLTKREREVCDRMLKGWTYEGIGVDLKISPGTVKTYRDRAFDRLGIHHRNELFALMSGQLL